MHINQITIFDILDSENEMLSFSVGDKVRVNWKAVQDKNDVESIYYLSGLKDKTGYVLQVIKKPKLQYRVQFGKETRYLYHDEITLWGEI